LAIESFSQPSDLEASMLKSCPLCYSSLLVEISGNTLHSIAAGKGKAESAHVCCNPNPERYILWQAVHIKADGKGKVEAAAAKKDTLAENKRNMLNTAPLPHTPKPKHRRSGSF